MCSDFFHMWKKLRKLPELQSFHINLIFHKDYRKADEGTCPFSFVGKILTKDLLNPHYGGNHLIVWQCGMLCSLFYSFSQQILFELLLGVKHWAGPGDMIMDNIEKFPFLQII